MKLVWFFLSLEVRFHHDESHWTHVTMWDCKVGHGRIVKTSIYARYGYSLVPVTTWGPELKRKTCQETPNYGTKNQWFPFGDLESRWSGHALFFRNHRHRLHEKTNITSKQEDCDTLSIKQKQVQTTDDWHMSTSLFTIITTTDDNVIHGKITIINNHH